VTAIRNARAPDGEHIAPKRMQASALDAMLDRVMREPEAA
jgi:hypothetical protein